MQLKEMIYQPGIDVIRKQSQMESWMNKGAKAKREMSGGAMKTDVRSRKVSRMIMLPMRT